MLFPRLVGSVIFYMSYIVLSVRLATIIYLDNVSVIYLSTNSVKHQRTKHVEIDIHFFCKKVALGHIQVIHVPSGYHFADIFTKDMSIEPFLDFR